MEVCRKCKQLIKDDQEFIKVICSWTLGFMGAGKYHIMCWEKSKKTGITIFGIILAAYIFIILILIIVRSLN